MDSPLARVILSILGGYLLILIGLTAFEWFEGEYPRPPAEPPSTDRIQHPFYHEQAVNALQRFARLSESKRDSIKESLKSGLISIEQWLPLLNQSDCRIMCIGELHEESTRNFLAKEFFAKVKVDVLLLEATPEALKRLTKRMNAGRTYFPLLDADIMAVLRTVRARNPDIQICGIEETEEQQGEQHRHSGSRDQSIAHNFWNRYRPGMRHLILFGALHCTNEPNWLYCNLYDRAPLPLKKRMVNVRILEEHQNGPVEAFIFFLDEIGIEKTSFVIPDTRTLPARICNWFPSLHRQTLQKYRTLIVFRR